jgi:hypothetical protein
MTNWLIESNLTSINTMYEMATSNSQALLNNSKMIEDNIKSYTDNLNASLEKIP